MRTDDGERPRNTVQGRILAQLRLDLMMGLFPSGEPLSIRKIATRFATSTMPVRDALTQLLAVNALEEFNGMIRVPVPDARRLREMIAARMVLEDMATRQACMRMNGAHLAALGAINERQLRAVTEGNTLECLAINHEFHFALYARAESDVLMPLIESLWMQSGPTLYRSLTTDGTHWSAQHHFGLLEALAKGDADMAARAVREDIASGTVVLFDKADEQTWSNTNLKDC